jgi:hypothetical protein
MYALRFEGQTRLDALRSAYFDKAQSLVLESQGDNTGGKATFSLQEPCIVHKTTAQTNGNTRTPVAFDAEANALLDVEVSSEGWPSELYVQDDISAEYGQDVLEHLGYNKKTQEPDTSLFPKSTSSTATFDLPASRYPSTLLFSSEHGNLLKPSSSGLRGANADQSKGNTYQDIINRLNQKGVRARIHPSDPNSIIATSSGDSKGVITDSITGPVSLRNADGTSWPGEITVNITSTVTLAGLQWRPVTAKSGGST